ncbi:MAG: hypothetical protein QM675_00420 [Protaetiibacter sp.]
MDPQVRLARLGRAIVDEHARLRVVRKVLIAATVVSLVAITVCVGALSGWAGASPAASIAGWASGAVSAVAVPLCALLATGVRRGRRYVLGMVDAYEELRKGASTTA